MKRLLLAALLFAVGYEVYDEVSTLHEYNRTHPLVDISRGAGATGHVLDVANGGAGATGHVLDVANGGTGIWHAGKYMSAGTFSSYGYTVAPIPCNAHVDSYLRGDGTCVTPVEINGEDSDEP